jgi:putative ABC transport system permease protein
LILWLKALFSGRMYAVVGAMAGIALTVALLGSLGIFVAIASKTMTQRAMNAVPVDWQIQLARGAQQGTVASALTAAVPGAQSQPIGYADVGGFVATTDSTTQTTGAGQVLGISPNYTTRFPDQIRLLLGAWDGALIYSQTAANLHVVPGDSVTIQRPGLPDVGVKISGIVSLPNADAMFQAVGVPKGLARQAPPDNVLILPQDAWRTLFEPRAEARSDMVRQQLHVRFPHGTLASDPSEAFVQVQHAANNFEAHVAGSAMLGDNLAARLDGVRADALYARVLLLFLGVPGLALSLLLTWAVAEATAGRRQREHALLRMRGASLVQLLRFACLEAAVLGLLGTLAGLVLAGLPALLWWGVAEIRLAWPWLAAAALIGFFAALVVLLLPSWRQATGQTVLAARAETGRHADPLWQRRHVDMLLLVLGGLAYWYYSRTGYELILAPEGVPQTVIHYEAFLAPALLWLGMGLLWLRIARLLLGRGRALMAAAVAPIGGALSPLIAVSLMRQRDRIAQGVALVALAFAFATSTSIFNTTYDAQGRIDAELTNGADVTLAGSTGQPAGALLDRLRAIPGVRAAEPMMHRYAYVGADLQDIYGIDPGRLPRVTTLANAYFANGSAAGTLAALGKMPDGVLVSAETVSDFQLQPGDIVNLRLQSAQDHQYHVVPFHFVGIAKEFPTAPRDSFLVANDAYLAKMTGSDAHEVVLLRTRGDGAKVADAARQIATPTPAIKVTTLDETRQIISSSLTAFNVAGLTRLELGFALLMIVGVAGLILGLDLEQRRRSFSLLSALGASREQVAAFLWSEGLVVVAGGALLGVAAGFGVAHTLVKVLSGAFDPPPETLVVPWAYLAATLAIAVASGALAIGLIQKMAQRPDLELLRQG